ncbi:MAG TPA: protein kinase [Tepidisphaeraceae bacterium]|jgi:serine/threonine protein kinase|nr:protein kinase [Tepidisphaeraceae bacterium]
MEVTCPYCKFVMVLKGTRPGRFGPSCQGCKAKFLLVISDDPSQPAKVSAIKQSATMATVVGATASAPPRAAAAVAHMPAAQPAVRETVAEFTAPPEPRPMPQAELLDVERAGKLGGYEIIKRLGQGGMGAVYLARQVSLDRPVAVKVMDPRLARDPSFVARFTREAYAAAQLTHHNIVQIHDIGQENQLHYFSMEFVPGRTLGAEAKAHGRLDPEAAVGYVLQAARGLKYAHDQAMIHRDIKPENLLLNEQGLVKVADLGLVKRQGVSEIAASSALGAASDASTTGAYLAMGTPAYMAPEQAANAATVDARADIYSLGCTLYDLLTGHPPFVGKTAAELITKHAREIPIPPDALVKNVPHQLSAILIKMIAKRPTDRYRSMGEVIKDLEEYLGISTGAGPFTPTEAHAKTLERSVAEFNGAPIARLRRTIIPAYFGLCAVVAILLLAAATRGSANAGTFVQWAGGIIGLAALSFASYILLTGITQRTHLFRKLRQYALGARLGDWARALVAIAVLFALLVLFHLQWYWLGFLIAAVGISAAFYFSIDLILARQRKAPLAQTEEMLKTMRLRGLDEDALRQFACRYAGPKWEEFYEALFGYDAKLRARRLYMAGTRGQGRKKFAAWRDPVIAWIDSRMRHRQEERDRLYLTAVEERKLRAQGVEQPMAKARKIANTVVSKAERMREVAADRAFAPTVPESTGIRVITAASLLEDAQSDDHVHRRHESYIQRKYGSIFGLLLGAQVRFFVGLGLLAVFALWMYQNNPNFLHNLAHHTGQSAQQPSAPALNDHPAPLAGDVPDQILPPSTTSKILGVIGSYPGGLAGAILVISGLFGGMRMGIGIFASAAVILLAGRAFSLPTFGLLRPDHTGMAAGAGLAALCFAFLRE